MKYYALLNNANVVLNIIVANNDWDSTGYVEYTNSNPAYIGGDYVDGYFYPPQPYTSWTRNQGNWNPPTPKPAEGFCTWDETILNWVENETLAE
jgi:hypothetical protein